MQRPLFSIIIPTYNVASTIEKALRSIIHQNYTNWEVLIMDGMSTDATLEIGHKFSLENPIYVNSEKDNGIYDAMNKGIELAKGEWVYFMGADDFFYDKDVLSIIVKNINNSIDIIYGNVFSTRFNGTYDGAFSYDKIAVKNICHQAIFFRKGIFDRIGKFNLKYKAHADWDHNLRWFFNSSVHKAYVNQIIANYADGGYSSINGDELFKSDKSMILYKLGFYKLSLDVRINVLNDILTGNHNLSLFKRMIFNALLVLSKLYRKIQ